VPLCLLSLCCFPFLLRYSLFRGSFIHLPSISRNVAKLYKAASTPFAARYETSESRGEILAWLGPAPCKSQSQKNHDHHLRPTYAEGTTQQSSAPIGPNPTLGRVGYLPENHASPRYLTGRMTSIFFRPHYRWNVYSATRKKKPPR